LNYLPFTGSYFYGGLTVFEMASYYCSYGLLAIAPEGVEITGFLLLLTMPIIPTIPEIPTVKTKRR